MHVHTHCVHKVTLTLSTVVACEALCAGARVLCTAASIHAPDIAGLDCRREDGEEREGDSWGVMGRN